MGLDWIERIFGVSPDGGNGMLEIAILVALLAVIVTITLVVRGRRRAGVRRRSWREHP